jgi:hypothetical protein
MRLGVTTTQFDAPIAKAGHFGLDVLIATNRRWAAGRYRLIGHLRGVDVDVNVTSSGWGRIGDRAQRGAVARADQRCAGVLPAHALQCHPHLPCCRGKLLRPARAAQAEMPTAEPGGCSAASSALATAALPPPPPAANNADSIYTGQLPPPPNKQPVVLSAAGARGAGLRFADVPCPQECNPRG